MATPLFSRHSDDQDNSPGFGTPISAAWEGLWGVVVFFGITCIVLGVIVVAWPSATVKVVAVLLGIQLLIMGVFRLLQAFSSRDASGGARTLLAFIGVLSLIVGVLCLRHILETVAVLGLLLGLFWLVGGVVEVFHAASERDHPNRGLALASGVLGTIAGLVVLAWPGVSVVAIAVVLGIWLIVFGFITAFGGVRLRRLGS